MPKLKVSFLSIFLAGYAFLALPSFVSADPPKVQEPPPPAEDAAQEQSSYVYDLKKLIEKSKDNIKRVNEKIQEQAIYKRNQLREEKAREYYERAVQLFEEGKPNEAREFWEKSIKITEHPEMKNYIKGSEKRFKVQSEALKKEEREREARANEDHRMKEQQAQEAYASAVTLYKQKKYKPARDEFILVEQLIPEYKGTRSYLKLLDQNIAVQDQEEKKQQQKEIARQQDEAEAARVREKEMWRKEIELKEEERRAKLTKQAQTVYKEAVDLYNKKDFVGAKEKFQEVEWVIPDYKHTRKYLDKLDADIKKHESEFVAAKQKERAQLGWKEELAHRKMEAQNKKEFELKSAEQKRIDAESAEVNYQAALKLIEAKKYAEARDKFLEVQKIYPDYKASASYLSRLNDKLGIIETAPEKVSDEVKEIYAEAVKAYKSKDLALAKFKFERVEFMYPNYESTRKYLSKLDKDYDMKKSVVGSTEAALRKEGGASELGILLQDGKIPDSKPVSSEEYDKLVEKAEPVYAEAMKLYEDKKFDDSFKKLQDVESILPNYKSTRPYLKRVNQQIKKVEQQRYKEEQMQQAETINLLARQANTLFHKIQQLSDDAATSSARKKFAMVDKLFANLSREQAKLLAEILEEEKKLQLEEIAYEQEVQKSEFANMIDPIYNEAVKLYQAKRYDEAKAKFLEAQSKLADYRSSSRYLALIEKQNLLLSQVMADREDRIKDYQAKAELSAQLQTKMELQEKERAMIQGLMAQAEAVNDEILSLSKDRNFELIKAKFAELEKIVDNLLTIKGVSSKRNLSESTPMRRSAPAKPSAADVKTDDVKAVQPLQNAQVKADDKKDADAASADKPAARPVPPAELTERQKFRQLDRQNRDAYHNAVRDFDAQRYSEAKVKFVSLEHQPGYARASRKYIDLIDQRVLKKQTRNLDKQKRNQEEFLKDRIERERMSYQIKESGLSEKPDARIPDVPIPSPSPAMPARNGLDSLNLRSRRTEQQEVNREQISSMKQIPSQPLERAAGMSPNEDASWADRKKQKDLSDRRKKYFDDKYKKAQMANVRSDRRDVATRRQVAQEERALSRRDTRRAASEARRVDAQIQAREKRNRDLYERHLRRAVDAKAEQAMAAADLQEQKDAQAEIRRQQDLLRQEREQEKSNRKDKERQISTMINHGRGSEKLAKAIEPKKSKPQTVEVKSAAEVPKAESKPEPVKIEPPKPEPAKLELAKVAPAQVKSAAPSAGTDEPLPEKPHQSSAINQAQVRQEFENGVEAMYKEAMSFYKSGMYAEARDKFSDIQDLSPGYKKTGKYIERSNKEIYKAQKKVQAAQAVGAANPKPAEPVVVSTNSARSLPTASPREELTTAARHDAISSALDTFESQTP